MSSVPSTSITLLKDLAHGSDSSRWTEFFRRYEAPMRGFLQSRFPSVEADDVLQETLLALTKALPDYRYTPDDHGHFRNYLMGIVRHKALDVLSHNAQHARTCDRVAKAELSRRETRPSTTAEDAEWRSAVLEAAVEQLMADASLTPTTREVFRHVALLHEEPSQVATDFGLTRNNVDQIKSRLLARLTALVRTMTENA